LHYTDLVADRDREMRRLADALGFEVDESRWPELVAAADFGEMKRRSAELVPDAGAGIIADADAFFSRAAVGEWRTARTGDQIARFEERLAALDPDGEIARWARFGLYS
jgi:aryl sulfotransferase